jgi:hypothetical protein
LYASNMAIMDVPGGLNATATTDKCISPIALLCNAPDFVLWRASSFSVATPATPAPSRGNVAAWYDVVEDDPTTSVGLTSGYVLKIAVDCSYRVRDRSRVSW